MIVSRKVTATGVAGVIATAAVWAADHFLHIQLDVQEVMLPLVALAVAAGWATKEDAAVLENLKLKGPRHRLTVSELLTLHQAGPAPTDDPDPERADDLSPVIEQPVERTIPHGRLASEHAREEAR